MQHTTDKQFSQDVLENSKPVLVDFWAEWCGPCKMLAPILDDVDKQMGDKVDIMKLNIDENPETPAKYGVRSIPTLVLFKDGQVMETKVGVLAQSTIQEWLENAL